MGDTHAPLTVRHIHTFCAKYQIKIENFFLFFFFFLGQKKKVESASCDAFFFLHTGRGDLCNYITPLPKKIMAKSIKHARAALFSSGAPACAPSIFFHKS